MHAPRNELARFLSRPEAFAAASLGDWDRLIPEARQAGLLARLANLVERAIGLDRVPAPVRVHLESAQIVAAKHARDVRAEIDRLVELLGPVLGRIVLLKGAAYLCADLPPASGRIFHDIDILVPSDALASVEAILGLAGWRLGDIDPYDEQYYRRWMHQLPPLVHAARQSAIDVHHTIVPATARIRLPAKALLAASMPIAGNPQIAVLAPEDMILHSAVHLFNEGEFARGLRDLDDLNMLLRHFGKEGAFWPKLVQRAEALDLTRPLFYALRYTHLLLETPVPPEILDLSVRFAPFAPARWLMVRLFERGLRAPHPNCRDAFTGTALWLLYVRAHYLRMPLHLLVPHLTRKALRSHFFHPEPA
jgi:Uncharacterised nucleotidyltransferase